jgi:predicted nucleic acid-binding protein
VAVQLSADVVVLDDLAARRKAMQLGLDVTGSAGLLVLAHRRGFIDAVRPDLDAMMANGLFIGRELYRDILGTTGEAET